MTAGFLRAAWVAGTGADALAYAELVGGQAGAGPTATYALTPKTPVMQDITGRLDHMDVDAYETLPTHVVLTEVADLDDGLELEAILVRDTSIDVVVAGLYREVATVIGTLGPPEDGPAAAIQLGTFTMRSAADEWAVSDWYRNRRFPSFSRIPGGHRARRYVSVCGGPGKLGVLYEFVSLGDRVEHFEPLETVDHDEQRPSAAARTVHPPMSPSVGTLLH